MLGVPTQRMSLRLLLRCRDTMKTNAEISVLLGHHTQIQTRCYVMNPEAKCTARKNAGLPASGDVAVLSTMLASLREAAESHLGHCIYSAAVTMPHLKALYLEDIHDAFEYLGLRKLDMPVRYGCLHETSTACAGYGFGLCSRYTDLASCKVEQQAMPDDVIMAILYTASALTVTLSVMKSAYYLWEPPYGHIEDFTLGSDSKYDTPDEAYYWERVRDRLREIMALYQYYERPSKVLVLGESAHEKKFQRSLNEALKTVMPALPDMYQADAEHAAALGAAEMAKRAPWDPYWLASDLGARNSLEILKERRDGI